MSRLANQFVQLGVNGGSNNGLTISNGGLWVGGRVGVGMGNGTDATNNNFYLITGTNDNTPSGVPSYFRENGATNTWFTVGNAANASGNSFRVEAGARADIFGTGISREFAIGKVIGSDNNYVKVDGVGSVLNFITGKELAVGGNSFNTVGGSGNHVDVFDGGALVMSNVDNVMPMPSAVSWTTWAAMPTTSTAMVLLGANSSLNIGNGTANTALVKIGSANGHFGVELTNATSSLNFNNGRLTAGVTGNLVTGNGTVNFNGLAYINTPSGSSNTINRPISGNGSLTKEGAGTLVLTNAAINYVGDTTVLAGTLSLTNPVLANAAAVRISAGATLDLNFSGTDTVGSLWLDGIQLDAGIYDSSNSNGYISGSGALNVVSGPPSPPEPPHNAISWIGTTNSLWGTATNWAGAVAPAATDIAVFDTGSTANLNTSPGASRSIHGLKITSPSGLITVGGFDTLTIGAGGIDMSAATRDLTFNAPLILAADQTWNVDTGRTVTVNSSAGGSSVQLTKSGSGSLILGNSQMSGTIFVNAGTLNFNSSGTNNCRAIVNNGGTLTGRGSFTNVTVNDGGILSPGADQFEMLFALRVDLNNSSIFKVRYLSYVFDGTNVLIYGDLNIANGAILDVAALSTNPDLIYNRSAAIFTYTGAWNGGIFKYVDDAGVPIDLPDDSVFTSHGRSYQISYDGGGSQKLITLTLIDITPPVVAAHGNVTVEATSAAGATVSYAAGSASDNVGVTSLTYSQNSGTVFPIGTTTVTITARDAANNAGTGSFTVTVRDTTAPVVAAHGNVTVEATSAAGATVTYAAGSATDAVGVTSLTYSQNSGTVFPIGTTTVTINARDAANNVGTGSFTVTVRDTTAPLLNQPVSPYVVEATSAAGAVVNYTLTATDVVDGAVSANGSPVSGSTFAIGDTTVSTSAADARGNTANSSFIVRVQDTTGPVFNPVPADRSVKSDAAGDLLLPDFAATASATDAVSSSVTITQSPAPGTAYVVGDQVSVTLTAKDALNNTSTATFIVTVTQGNRPPMANADRALVYNASTLVDVLANDTDPDGDALTITGVTSPASGGETLIEGNKIRFTPDATFTSATPVTFDYTATDGEFSSTSSVTIYHTPDKTASFAALLSDASGKPRGLFKFDMFLGGTGTGNIVRDGKLTNFKANLVDAGVVVPALRTTPAISISFPMIDVDSADKPVLGIHVLSATGEHLTGTARVSPYDATHAAPQSALYTLAATGTSPEIAAVLYGSVSPKGAVRFVGKLGNFSSASFSGQVLANGEVPFYMGVASRTKVNALGGTLTIGTGSAPQISGTLKWNLPATMDTRIPAGVSADYAATGARYTRAAAGTDMLTLNAAKTVTEDFYLPVNTPINLSADATVGATTIGPNPLIKLSPRVGIFNCARLTLLTEPIAFYGIVIQGTGLNYGIGIIRSKTAIGTVDITPKP